MVLTGTIAADSAPVVNVWAFNDPATYARTAFIEALGRAGVTVTADPVVTNPAAALPAKADVDALTSVAELTSLPSAEEVTYINKISFNVGGETMFCRLAVAAGSDDCEQGLLKGRRDLEGGGAGHQCRRARRRIRTDRQPRHPEQSGRAPDDHVQARGRPGLAGHAADPRGRRLARDGAGERPGDGQGRSARPAPWSQGTGSTTGTGCR